MFAAVTAYYWKKKFPEDNLYILTSLSVLLIACPAAFANALPIARLVGSVKALKKGFLIQKMEALSKVEGITTIAFDKTGTLTSGRPTVAGFKAAENIAHNQILKLAASLEAFSPHPYAECVRQKARDEQLNPYPVEDLESVAGKGIKGRVLVEGKSQAVVIGSLYFLLEQGYEMTNVPNEFRWEAEGSGMTTLWLGIDQKFAGLLFLKEELRKEAKLLTEKLIHQKYDVGMITGDTEFVAADLQKKLGLKFIHAGVLPREKAALIKKLSLPRKKGLDTVHPKVAFVGDGINDAPALREAHLGIAINSLDQESAIEADIHIRFGDIRSVDQVFKVLKSAQHLGRENLLLGIGYNFLAIPLAAGVLIPFYHFHVTPWTAALAMSLLSLTLMLNAARHLR